MYCTKGDWDQPEPMINEFILPLMDKKDINLLEYKDYKDNNVLHLFFKGRVPDRYGFLKEKVFLYMPDDLDSEAKIEGLKKLLNQKNNYELDKFSPFEMAFEENDEVLIKLIS